MEFKIPIFSMLTGSLAGRYDKYDDITDVDDARTWGAGLEFRPFDSLLVRANYATSFKAPEQAPLTFQNASQTIHHSA